MKLFSLFLTAFFSLVLTGCSTKPPSDVTVIQNFDANRYLGTWYEIARLDHSFEKGLEQVTANYKLRSDGGLDVINRGYNPNKKRWQESDGRAYFVDSPNVASLKVTFFWPFYGGYNVIVLDDNYQYALVCGPNKKYLWILSRTPTLDQNIKDSLVAKAKALGFATEELIWVKQDSI
ncbi:outer membrane lipoprotein Blc [Entomomonas asaccharolytica]|uniref:Outer membrane lipoprotein Blc n=1 Tax=Entomomonas asaccharolytica TaxID=2785331 RepID=A0A974NFH9_9GAMM|nr:outer membrane lipoprotein Blc [Entomomonas asaccharolytica]QQP85681.1 outer membrane lipoprotein Blc [Entomomonas asaccharolytica]